ncbi:MAG: hypothetical protein AAF628_27140 [Planctomycetota bacterium]
MSADPTEPIRRMAASLAGAAEGTACNQSSFKVGKSAFLFIGPGAKGVGYKAMFKLATSMPEAQELAATQPERFGAGSGGWVTARFTADQPLRKTLWAKWLKESHRLALGGGTAAAKKAGRKKTGRKA